MSFFPAMVVFPFKDSVLAPYARWSKVPALRRTPPSCLTR